ncbi:MAG: hypothetical protein ACSLE6_05395 [Mycobacterium sp.]
MNQFRFEETGSTMKTPGLVDLVASRDAFGDMLRDIEAGPIVFLGMIAPTLFAIFVLRAAIKRHEIASAVLAGSVPFILAGQILAWYLYHANEWSNQGLSGSMTVVILAWILSVGILIVGSALIHRADSRSAFSVGR